ncbi:MAG: hypothetical protein ACRDJN_14090, partial [Chloroflexota bacterium]
MLPLHRLRSLDLKLGRTKDLRLLPEIGHLRYLELWRVKGLADLDPVAAVVGGQNFGRLRRRTRTRGAGRRGWAATGPNEE